MIKTPSHHLPRRSHGTGPHPTPTAGHLPLPPGEHLEHPGRSWHGPAPKIHQEKGTRVTHRSLTQALGGFPGFLGPPWTCCGRRWNFPFGPWWPLPGNTRNIPVKSGGSPPSFFPLLWGKAPGEVESPTTPGNVFLPTAPNQHLGIPAPGSARNQKG